MVKPVINIKQIFQLLVFHGINAGYQWTSQWYP